MKISQSKQKHIFAIGNKNGSTLVIIMLMSATLLVLGMYFLSIALTEKKISISQAQGISAYYLAETGINEMIWLIKNDPTYKSNFENLNNWQATSTRVDPFGIGSGSYEVVITNSTKAHAEILSTGSKDIGGGKTSHRIVRTYVYKALGSSAIGNSSGFTDGNITISKSLVNFINGDAFASSNNFIVNTNSIVNIDGDMKAMGQINITNSVVNVGGGMYDSSATYPPTPTPIIMPSVDFNSTSSLSYKNQAMSALTLYTEAAFEALIDSADVIIINDPITYVAGDVELDGDKTLIINNGLLVVENDFSVGDKAGSNNGNTLSLKITYASGTPAGVFAARHIIFDKYTEDVDVEGVIYASDWAQVKNIPASVNKFEIIGGLVGRKLHVNACDKEINIIHDLDILLDSLGSASSSPTIVVEHWEEEY